VSKALSCRLLVDPPQSGAWNMAVDEALLSEAASEGIASLRFYEWSEPTLSLGYFQKYADRVQHPASASAAIVRRQTGGGAIVHDRELTYSIALPRNHPLAANAQSLYSAVHEVIAAALCNRLSAACDPAAIQLFCKNAPEPSGAEPFLCFERRARGDIVFLGRSTKNSADDHMLDYKIVGSAQRRSRGAVLQHGSILLERSRCGPELAGFNDVCDNRVTTTFLTSELLTQLSKLVGMVFGGMESHERTLSDICERSLDSKCRALATILQEEKYGNRLWTQRR
jgi:lipoyl(octanoyl) transferase